MTIVLLNNRAHQGWQPKLAWAFGLWCLLFPLDGRSTLPPVSVVLEAIADDGSARIVEPNEILCSGERFRLEVEVQHISFIYVVQGRDRKATVLYPAQGMSALRLGPGQVHRLPEDMDFELDNRPGVEHIIVVVSKQPLQEQVVTDMALESMRRVGPMPKPLNVRICSAGSRQPASGQPAPDGSMERYREVVLRQRLSGRSVVGTTAVHVMIFHQ